jgi:hypothetical protein
MVEFVGYRIIVQEECIVPIEAMGMLYCAALCRLYIPCTLRVGIHHIGHIGHVGHYQTFPYSGTGLPDGYCAFDVSRFEVTVAFGVPIPLASCTLGNAVRILFFTAKYIPH